MHMHGENLGMRPMCCRTFISEATFHRDFAHELMKAACLVKLLAHSLSVSNPGVSLVVLWCGPESGAGCCHTGAHLA